MGVRRSIWTDLRRPLQSTSTDRLYAKARILELPALSEEIETEETEAAADLEVSDEDDGV